MNLPRFSRRLAATVLTTSRWFCDGFHDDSRRFHDDLHRLRDGVFRDRLAPTSRPRFSRRLRDGFPRRPRLAGTRRRKVLKPHDSSALLSELRTEARGRRRQQRRQLVQEKRVVQRAHVERLQQWEDELLAEGRREQLRAMWEVGRQAERPGKFLLAHFGTTGEIIDACERKKLTKVIFLPVSGSVYWLCTRRVLGRLGGATWCSVSNLAGPMFPRTVYRHRLAGASHTVSDSADRPRPVPLRRALPRLPAPPSGRVSHRFRSRRSATSCSSARPRSAWRRWCTTNLSGRSSCHARAVRCTTWWRRSSAPPTSARGNYARRRFVAQLEMRFVKFYFLELRMF